jgi:transposase
MSRRAYPTDLTDAQWAIREPLVPPPQPGGRPPAHARRELINADPADARPNGAIMAPLMQVNRKCRAGEDCMLGGAG